MTTATDPRSSVTPKPAAVDRLRVSSYDRASGWLVAGIIFIGFFVVLMFLMWLTSVLEFSQMAVPVTMLDEPSGRGEHAAGYERDFEEPGLEEVDDLLEPQLEALLEAVTDVVTTQAASLDALQTDADFSGRGRGLGDSRQAGAGGEGNAIPRWERWQVRFAAKSVGEYARQLDAFNIELAAVGGGAAEVDYAGKLSGSTPSRRTGRGDQEQRLYMTWRGGTLEQFDRQLLAKAGIDTQGRILLQMYTPAVENQLAALEQQKAGGRSVDEIRRTIFGVRRAGARYEFYVIEQTYRNAPS